MQFEQHLNLEKMVGHGAGIMLSRHHFRDHEFVRTIEEIFANYDRYYQKAQQLMKTLPPPKGDVNATKRILELLNEFENK